MASNAQLIDVRKIWDRAPHNAMTDLVRYGNAWVCVFREGEGHISPDGQIRILKSDNGLLWVSYYSSHENRVSVYFAKVKLP